MKTKNIFYLLLSVIALTSCNKKEIDFSKQIYDDTGLHLNGYKVLQDENSSAIGDYTENYYVKIDSVEFISVLKQIKNDLNWNKTPYGYNFQSYEKEYNKSKTYEFNVTNKTINYLYSED